MSFREMTLLLAACCAVAEVSAQEPAAAPSGGPKVSATASPQSPTQIKPSQRLSPQASAATGTRAALPGEKLAAVSKTLGTVHSSPAMDTAEERAEADAVRKHQDPRKAVEKIQQKDRTPPPR